MKVWLGPAVVGLALIACSSSSSTSGPGGGDTDGGQPPVTQTIGAAGGSVTAQGVELTIPPGALATDTAIAITPNAGAIPSGYTGLSQLYAFSPDGTVFQKPATVAFTLSGGTSPTVYWSNTSGGYDALATTPTGRGVSASILHFSHGFVGEAKKDATDAGSDSGASDGGSTRDSSTTSDGSTTTDGGTTNAIIATLDSASTTTTFSANASVVLGNGTTTIKADDNGTSTHWTLEIVVITGVQAGQCLPNGNIYINYQHYTNGNADWLYSSKVQGGCVILVTNYPTVPGTHAKGTFSGTVGALNLPTNFPPTHVFQNGTFNLTL
jgi:hypothetical protein